MADGKKVKYMQWKGWFQPITMPWLLFCLLLFMGYRNRKTFLKENTEGDSIAATTPYF